MSNSSNLIELIAQELETKMGIFLNPKTGNAWKLYMQDGEIIIAVPNFSFQISPSTGSRFRPVDTLINLEIEFKKPDQHTSLRMHIYAKSIKRATFLLF